MTAGALWVYTYTIVYTCNASIYTLNGNVRGYDSLSCMVVAYHTWLITTINCISSYTDSTKTLIARLAAGPSTNFP